ncbi:DUF2809 domain-containing protein [Comamonas sp.]|uniref:ribosomal maturation YjgA family protein n=1 Tax=Comamonas sp. TaxID=34028 RepID=UPI003A940FD2
MLASSFAFRRSRVLLTLLALIVIALGLASRRGWLPFPAVLGNYPGDALWAWVVLLCVAWLRPAMACSRLAAFSLLIAFAIEFLQLYQAPWMQALRAHKLAYLVLGNGFDPMDLVAYVVGVGLGVVVDWAWARQLQRRRMPMAPVIWH